MKNRAKKIVSLVTLLSLGFVNTGFAAGFPSEPMVIYGNVTGSNIENKTMKIYNESDELLKSVSIYNNAYGSKKTFDLENKIIIPEFTGQLKFKIDESVATVSKGEIANCNSTATFQIAAICEYNLNFSGLESADETVISDIENISEEDMTEYYDDIFHGQVLDATVDIVEQELGDNIMENAEISDTVVVVNKNVNVGTKVMKDLVIVSNSQKDMIFLPKDTGLSGSDIVIKKPITIGNTSTIKSKINKDVFAAVDVPTNKQISFDKKARICTPISTSSPVGLKVYYSHDGSNWSIDNNVTNLKIANNQVCFNVIHLTSFAVAKDSPSSGGGGGGGGLSKDSCPNGDDSPSYYDRKCEAEVSVVHNESSDNSSENTTESSTTPTSQNTNLSQETRNSIKNISEKGTMKGKDYIRGLKLFIQNKKESKKVFGLDILHVKGDDEYNKKTDALAKSVYKSMKIGSIRKDMIKYIDSMTTSYGVYNDDTIDADLKAIFKEKLKYDIAKVEQKMKVLKRKDMIISTVLEKRRLAKIGE